MVKYQNISEFMHSPFGRGIKLDKQLEYEKMYEELRRTDKIRLQACCQFESSYYIHVTIPSETQKDNKYQYDVVLRFFTDDPNVEKDSTLARYHIQFFSNSPSFMYKYAVLYKINGYLIESFYKKMDPEFLNTLPEKTNADMELSYDKSIYFAIKYLSQKKFKLLSKSSIAFSVHKTSFAGLMNGISDFKSVKFDQELMNSERKLKRELEKKKKSKLASNQRKENDSHRKNSKSTTRKSTDGIVKVTRITAGGRKPKVARKKSTRKEK